MQNRKTRVLIVDDSAIVRKTLTEALAAEPDLEVVGTAPDPYIARDKIVALSPDVMTLDIEMPRMDGLTFLKKLMQHHPLPVIVISSLGNSSCETALQALRAGAVDFMPKPGGPYSVGNLRHELASKIRTASGANLKRREAEPVTPEADPMRAVTLEWSGRTSLLPLIASGASTGGTEAIREVLGLLPAGLPPIVITQHIPPVFSRSFAESLSRTCHFRVKEAADGDQLEPGLALVAPGDYHMVIRRVGATFRVHLTQTPPVCYQRPAVDVMFRSVADAAGKNVVAAVLTGMGSDGANGLKHMHDLGAFTLAQDEASCVVYGMPRAAVAAGGVDRVVSLNRMARAILDGVMARQPSTAQN